MHGIPTEDWRGRERKMRAQEETGIAVHLISVSNRMDSFINLKAFS